MRQMAEQSMREVWPMLVASAQPAVASAAETLDTKRGAACICYKEAK